jgi:hypothetical protein
LRVRAPTNDLVFITEKLFFDRVVQNQTTVVRFDAKILRFFKRLRKFNQ